MAKQFNKIGVTSEGYRGNRAILDQRVIEGFERASFVGNVCRLAQDCSQTLYLDNDNHSSEDNYIILPDATTLWPNWKLAVINDSSLPIKIYYYAETGGELNFFKEVSDGNMSTLILLDDTTSEGKWTYLRTTERVNVDAIDRFTTNVFETHTISWGQLQTEDAEVAINIGTILAGTAIKSVYIKPTAQFVGATALTVSVGLPTAKTKFLPAFDLTDTISDDYFSKDVYEEILSTTSNTDVYAYFSGTGLMNLESGSVDIIIERTKTIDPTVLKNPIVQTQVPLGVIMSYSFTDTPDGFKRLDGKAFPNAESTIPQFVERLRRADNESVNEKLIISYNEWKNIERQYGSCGKFAWNGVDLVFPKISCFIQGLTDITQMAKLIPAGLPNHTHGPLTVQGSLDDNGDPGQYILTDGGGFYGTATNQGYTGGVREGGVWGNSDTVQPTSVRFPYIISIYSKIQASSDFDLDAIIAVTTGKANTSLDNITQEGENVIKGVVNRMNVAGTPDFNRAFNLSNNTDYNLGYSIWLFTHNELMNATASMYINGVEYMMSGFDSNDGHGSSCVFYIPAGNTFRCRNMSRITVWPLVQG